MRRDIEFDAEGTTLRGWVYVPDNASGPAPAIVMCHGYSAVKELFLDAFAEVFCDAGFCALVYDNRNLGASDGEPRQEIDPWAQVRDYRHAITFARTLNEVDGERIGVWGSSYSAALAFVLAAAHPGDVDAIVAFSPGEYLAGKQAVRSAAAKVDVPVWIDQASSAEEIARSAAILKTVKTSDKRQFSAKVKSTHGSSTLRADTNPIGAETHWQAVLAFLGRFRGS